MEQRKINKNRVLVLSIFFIACISTYFLKIYFSKTVATTATATAIAKTSSGQLTDYGLKYGNKNAPIKIIEYSSFQCPDCLELHNNATASLKKYIDAGKIFYVFKPTDTTFLRVPVKYEHGFDNLAKIFHSKSVFGRISIAEAKKSLGVKKYAERETLLEKIISEVDSLEIQVIPTMLINGEKLVGLYSKNDFEKILEKAMKNYK